jgi:peptidoglycan/xylan/chitin deacetylase (PgdA/CDA1 family)
LRMYLTTTPWWLRKMYSPGLLWDMPSENNVYLTFDDGPHPTITPFVLGLLKQYNAKATFFCIGKNVKQYPAIYQQIIDDGHIVGNHTYNHLNGWKTGDAVYIKNVLYAKNIINSNLLRPPYGRISGRQVQELKPAFKIVMWSVLSGDFDVSIGGEKCYNNVIKSAKPGSVIVFHDSDKAFPRLENALPKVLQFFTEKGYTMTSISQVE